jgi:hypothetical protein
MSDQEIKRRAKAGQRMLEALSGQMLAEWRARQFFLSTLPGDRGAMSPLGGAMKQSEEPAKPAATKPKKFVW